MAKGKGRYVKSETNLKIQEYKRLVLKWQLAPEKTQAQKDAKNAIARRINDMNPIIDKMQADDSRKKKSQYR